MGSSLKEKHHLQNGYLSILKLIKMKLTKTQIIVTILLFILFISIAIKVWGIF